MTKRIYSYIVIFAASALLVFSCKKDDDEQVLFSSAVDVTKTDLAGDRENVAIMFSKDGGTTYTLTPTLSAGQKIKTKLVHFTDANYQAYEDLSPDNFDFDWSASKPAPTSGAASNIAEFVFGNSSSIKVTMVNHHCAYDASSWTGAWGGDEVGACCGGTDANNITQDTVDPNKFIMDNFWGDHVDAYFIMTPSTSAYDQVLTMPTQDTSEGGVASGTGTYDQCAGTFTIATKYVIGGGTYEWQYNFHR